MTREKEVFVKALKGFVASGFKESLFTKSLYQPLSSCFGHIEHRNKAGGFYDVWFSSPDKQVRWLLHVCNTETHGDPMFCYVDAEREIQAWLKKHPEYRERAQAAVTPSRENRLEAALQKIVALEYEDIHNAKAIATAALRP
jgi:hypothetical protein